MSLSYTENELNHLQLINKIIFMKRLLFLVVASLLVISGYAQNSGEWENLFNGKDLKGWKQLNGNAKFEAVNGEIVGTSVLNTPNSFLATEKDYGDFVLELEMFLESDVNSGIQFRSQSLPEYNNGRVHGYQCEVDPSPRAWSGGIFDEARRGWLYPLDINPAAKPALKAGEWNHYKIECIGPSIRIWLNGIPSAWLIDDMTPKGFIALQVHSINRKELEGGKIRWRNIRIKTSNLKPAPFDDIYVVNLLPNNLSNAEKQQGFKLLFDGKTTNGWKSANAESFPAQGWEVKDNNLTVLASGGPGSKRGGDIVTTEKFKAFELRFDFNMSEGANSGIKYFTGNNGPSIGLEYQILDDAKHPDASQGAAGNRTLGSLYDLIPAEKEGRFVNKPGDWNRGSIVVYPDNRVEHWLNGRKVLEFVRGNNIYRALVARSKYVGFEGFGMAEETPILLQDHNDLVHFRNIKIRELK
jgi:hypothetical protein